MAISVNVSKPTIQDWLYVYTKLAKSIGIDVDNMKPLTKQEEEEYEILKEANRKRIEKEYGGTINLGQPRIVTIVEKNPYPKQPNITKRYLDLIGNKPLPEISFSDSNADKLPSI